MEVAIIACLLAKGNMNVNACHILPGNEKRLIDDLAKLILLTERSWMKQVNDNILFLRMMGMGNTSWFLRLMITFSVLCLTGFSLKAQDTIMSSGTTPVSTVITGIRADSASTILSLPSFTKQSFDNYGSFVQYLMTHNQIFDSTRATLPAVIAFRSSIEKDRDGLFNGIFYVILGVFFLLAILRSAFTKYFSDLFRAFFNPTLSQRQLREQLSQTPFPSLMLNFFFAVSTGLYLFLVMLHFHYFMVSRPLYLIPVFAGLIVIIYVVKYIFLRFAGWLFGYPETAAAYVFTLYMINKVLGVALLPFILVLAFSPPSIAGVALDISLILIIILFIYRYVRIYGIARNQIFFHKFHFFIYLCGFEIAPILIVGKLVLIWLNGA